MSDDSRPSAHRGHSGACPRCGEPLPKRTTGRPPKWCSQRCRRAAYEERRAAANGAIAIKFVEPVLIDSEHDLSECARRASASPVACRRILQMLTELARDGKLQYDPKWEATIGVVARLADALWSHSARRF